MLAAAGDVNGDGRQDVAVGVQDDVRTRDPASLTEIAVVGFGPAPPDPTRPDFTGLVVTHLDEPALFDDGGRSVGGSAAGIGDFDGDGLGDVAFGEIGAAPNGRANAGSVYVVLGRRDPGTIDVRTDPRIVRIDGPAREARGSAWGFAAAGDFDGDGRPDLVVAVPGKGAVIVRGGVPAGTTIDLARPPAGSAIELRGLGAGPPARGQRGRRGPDVRRGRGRRRRRPRRAAGRAGAGESVQRSPPGARRAWRRRGRRGGRAALAARTHRRARPTTSGFGSALATMPDTDGDGRPEWLIGTAVGRFRPVG